jgi:hypothetical protein
MHGKINDLVLSTNYGEKINIIEGICGTIIEVLKKQGLSDSQSDFLLDHGPQMQSKIKDRTLKERNVWIG